MSSFKRGQRVVCIKKGPWKNKVNDDEIGPKYKEELIIDEIVTDILGDECLVFDNYPHMYLSWRFRPVELDYEFVEEVLQMIKTKHKELVN